MINYSIGGTAKLGMHYNLSGTPGQIVIPPGASSAVVTVNAQMTSLTRGSETVTLTLSNGTGYSVAPPGAATLTIDNTVAKPPTVRLSVSPAGINEGGVATFTASATTVNPSQPITVRYAMSGTGVLGQHYSISGTPGEITIPAGALSGTVTLNALTTGLTSGSETATMTLHPGPGYKLSRSKPAKTSTVTINNLP